MTLPALATQSLLVAAPHMAVDFIPSTMHFSGDAIKARVRTEWEALPDLYATALEELPTNEPSREFKSITALREFAADKPVSTPFKISPLLKDLLSPTHFAVSGVVCLLSVATLATPLISMSQFKISPLLKDLLSPIHFAVSGAVCLLSAATLATPLISMSLGLLGFYIGFMTCVRIIADDLDARFISVAAVKPPKLEEERRFLAAQEQATQSQGGRS